QALAVRASLARGRDLTPVTVITTPGLLESLDMPVSDYQPLAELRRGGCAVADIFLRVALVPNVVSSGGRMVSVPRDQVGEELPGALFYLVVVQAEPGCSADGGTDLH